MTLAPVDALTSDLAKIRAAWLADIPCHELLRANPDEMHQALILSEYSRLGWAAWKMEKRK